MIRLALFGSPIQSSLSPRIHQLFAAQFDLEIEFQSIETQVDGFAQALDEFRLAGGIGCNVTLPLKRVAWQLATASTTAVSLAEAANTLVIQPSGWLAHNTDGIGLLTDLQDNHGVEIARKRLLILGAGGAAAGIFSSLQQAGPADIVVVNRNLERAGTLADRFGTDGQVAVSSWENLPEQGSFDLVINATSLGHQGQAPALTSSLFATDALCYDLNYFKASQPLKKHCEELGQPYIDGLGMLVEQAARSFCIWTDKQPDSRVVIDACRRNTD